MPYLDFSIRENSNRFVPALAAFNFFESSVDFAFSCLPPLASCLPAFALAFGGMNALPACYELG